MATASSAAGAPEAEAPEAEAPGQRVDTQSSLEAFFSRQLSNFTTTIEERLGSSLKSLLSQMEGLTAHVKDLEARCAAAELLAADAKESLKGGPKSPGGSAQLASLSSRLANQEARFAQLEPALDQSFSAFRTELDGLARDVSSLKKRVSESDGRAAVEVSSASTSSGQGAPRASAIMRDLRPVGGGSTGGVDVIHPQPEVPLEDEDGPIPTGYQGPASPAPAVASASVSVAPPAPTLAGPTTLTAQAGSTPPGAPAASSAASSEPAKPSESEGTATTLSALTGLATTMAQATSGLLAAVSQLSQLTTQSAATNNQTAPSSGARPSKKGKPRRSPPQPPVQPQLQTYGQPVDLAQLAAALAASPGQANQAVQPAATSQAPEQPQWRTVVNRSRQPSPPQSTPLTSLPAQYELARVTGGIVLPEIGLCSVVSRDFNSRSLQLRAPNGTLFHLQDAGVANTPEGYRACYSVKDARYPRLNNAMLWSRSFLLKINQS